MSIVARKASFDLRVKQFGGPLNEPAVYAQFLAQVEHESGGFKHVREIWGPTKAQRGYEGRKDLGNTQSGDGKRFMGRDAVQITGRANYRALTAWVHKEFKGNVDFEASPELLEAPEWLGIGAIWYFLAARKDLIRFCREGNNEMVTRRVNGGLNGYADRLARYDRIALGILGHGTILNFQKQAGLVPDGISGPKTRAAMHKALQGVKPQSVTEAPIIPGKRTDIPSPPPRGKPSGPIALVLLAAIGAVATAASGAWNWLLGLFN